MHRWIKDFWIGSEPVEFLSSYGLAESVTRLQAATRRWSIFSLSEQAAVGRVSESQVSLQRVIPMIGNSFKPVFVGRFQQGQAGIVLAGRFTLNGFVKLFMTFWLGFCVLFVVLALSIAVQKPAAALMALPGVGMLVLGFGMTRLFAWFSRSDPAWISNVICTALQSSISTKETSTPTASSKPVNRRPRFILIATGIFCLFGLMSVVGALRDVNANAIHVSSHLMARYPLGVRIAAAVNGALLLACAYGIYRRHLLAWWAGFALLLLGQACSMVDLLTRDDAASAHIPATLFCFLSLIIAGVWGCWWYAQRTHFRK